jgi:hypothetical protein
MKEQRRIQTTKDKGITVRFVTVISARWSCTADAGCAVRVPAGSHTFLTRVACGSPLHLKAYLGIMTSNRSQRPHSVYRLRLSTSVYIYIYIYTQSMYRK